jgi:hypothetical protein
LLAALQERDTSHNHEQNHLLHVPSIPATRGNAGRQARAGYAAWVAQETRNGHEFAGHIAASFMISLAAIKAMTPKPASLTVRAIHWPINITTIVDLIKVLVEGRDGP